MALIGEYGKNKPRICWIDANIVKRSELFTRQGHSPGIQYPRVLGIEAVGTVQECPSQKFKKGDIVATAMNG